MKVAQSCLILCDPMDYTVDGILQASILESVAFPFSRGSSRPRAGTRVSCLSRRVFTAEPPGSPVFPVLGLEWADSVDVGPVDIEGQLYSGAHEFRWA